MRTAGVGWGALVHLTPVTTRPQVTPVIAVDSMDNVHIVWRGSDWGAWPLVDQILHIVKTAGVWGAINLLTNTANRQENPSIAIDSGDILHLVWSGLGWGANPAVLNLRYCQRSAAGVWGASEAVTDMGQIQNLPCIALDSSMNPHVGWNGRGWPVNPGNWQVQYRARIAGVWGAVEAIGGDAVNETNANISIDTLDIIHVFWSQPIGGFANVRYRARTAGIWGAPIDLTARAFAQGPGIGLFAYHPFISGASSNIPGAGYLMLLAGQDATGTQIEFWIPPGFAWKPLLPDVTTDMATSIGATSSVLNGTLDDDGGEACDCGFEWGETVAYGNTTPTQSRTTGQSFSQLIAGLTPNTTYHFRAFATNATGTSYGADRTFTILGPRLPSVQTLAASGVT